MTGGPSRGPCPADPACSEACHFYQGTQDPKYTPIWKLEPFKQAYKREYGPFAVIYRALNLKQKVTVERLQELGRLHVVADHGVVDEALDAVARQALFNSGNG